MRKEEKGRTGNGNAGDNSAAVAAQDAGARSRSTAAQGMPTQGATAREWQQAKWPEKRQHLEQGVAGERELQQKKRKR